MDQQRYVIEAGGRTAGLVIQEQSGYRFFSSAKMFNTLDRVVFRSPGHAESACRAYARKAVGETSGRGKFSTPAKNQEEDPAPLRSRSA